MMNFFKGCWQLRWVRALAWSAITIVTLCVLFCAWVNWSGARQWREVQAMLKAEGETLDFREVAREPVPEAENFCAIPLLKDIALAVDGDVSKGAPAEKRARLDAVKLPLGNKAAPRPNFSSAALGMPADMQAWADWLRKEGSLPMPADSGDPARDVLAALSKHDAVFRELAAGLDRPSAQWTPEWKTRELPPILISILLPHYSVERALSQTLSLEAIAAARADNGGRAHETAQILARFAEANLNEPFLIGLMVAAADADVLSGVTWELCAGHIGTARDFARLEAALMQLNFHRALLLAHRSELAFSVNALQSLKAMRSEVAAAFLMKGGENDTYANLSRAVPSGFFDASTAVIADREFQKMIRPLRDRGWAAAFQGAKDFENEIVGMKPDTWTQPSWLRIAIFDPTLSNVTYRAACSQALIDETVIACALERYRIEHGNYPDSLEAVKLADGQPLPLDLMNGKPVGYRKTADGRYALWSVGFDGTDDGGKRVLDKKRPANTRFHNAKYVGDWVWDFPVK